MMPIHLTQALIPAHPTNRVFHLDPSLRERPIEGNILWRAVFATWFAARTRSQSCRMLLANAHVGQIPDRAHPFWQAFEQLRVAQNLHNGSRPFYTLSHITDQAILLIDCYLRLERMLLLFTAVVAIGLGTLSRALHTLLEGIDDHHQFGRLTQQGVERLAALAARVRH